MAKKTRTSYVHRQAKKIYTIGFTYTNKEDLKVYVQSKDSPTIIEVTDFDIENYGKDINLKRDIGKDGDYLIIQRVVSNDQAYFPILGSVIDSVALSKEVTRLSQLTQEIDERAKGNIVTLDGDEKNKLPETRANKLVAYMEDGITLDLSIDKFDSKSDAEAAKKAATEAKVSAEQASNFATEAMYSERNAHASATNAQSSENASKHSEEQSKLSADKAKLSEDNAKASEDNALKSATNAKLSEDNALKSATEAQTYKNQAQVASNQAIEAKNLAEAYKNDAEVAKNDAFVAKSLAQISADKAEESKDKAEEILVEIDDHIKDKQDKLIAGQNITIDDDGKTINSTGAVGLKINGAGGESSNTSAEFVNIGKGITSTGVYTTAVGNNSKTNEASQATAIGYASEATQKYSTSLGCEAKANAQGSTVVGTQARSDGQYSTAVGSYSVGGNQRVTSVGSQAQVTAVDSEAFGYRSKATFSNSTAIGAYTNTTEANQVHIGGRKLSGVTNGTSSTDAVNKEQLDLKQDILIAGENITIDGNIISASGGGGGGVEDNASGYSYGLRGEAQWLNIMTACQGVGYGSIGLSTSSQPTYSRNILIGDGNTSNTSSSAVLEYNEDSILIGQGNVYETCSSQSYKATVIGSNNLVTMQGYSSHCASETLLGSNNYISQISISDSKYILVGNSNYIDNSYKSMIVGNGNEYDNTNDYGSSFFTNNLIGNNNKITVNNSGSGLNSNTILGNDYKVTNGLNSSDMGDNFTTTITSIVANNFNESYSMGAVMHVFTDCGSNPWVGFSTIDHMMNIESGFAVSFDDLRNSFLQSGAYVININRTINY